MEAPNSISDAKVNVALAAAFIVKAGTAYGAWLALLNRTKTYNVVCHFSRTPDQNLKVPVWTEPIWFYTLPYVYLMEGKCLKYIK